MNKKLNHFFLGAILAIAMIIPLFPQSASAQTNDGSTNTTRAISIFQFNARAVQFTTTMVAASRTFGQQRLLFLAAAQLGTPINLLTTEFTDAGLSVDNFILAVLMARSAGVRDHFVIDLLNSGRNFGQIALQLNLPTRLTFLRLNSFADVITQEIALTNGVSVNDQASIQARLALLLDGINNRFFVFQNIVGDQAFNVLLINRLALETGLTVDIIIILRTQLINLSPAEFTTMLLVRNSVGAVVTNPLIFGDDSLTPLAILSLLNNSDVPPALLLNRLAFFQRMVGNSFTG